MDSSVDELFTLLKQQSKKAVVQVPEEQSDELRLDDPVDRDAQEKFEEIDKNLRSLPKLRNEFDSLVHKKDKAQPTKLHSEDDQYKDWFLLPKPDKAARDRAQRDLLLLKHRSALDPKRHYKKDRWQVPERFALGTVIEGTSSASTRKHSGSTMLDTLLSDQDTQHYFKRKYSQIQQQRSNRRRTVRKRR